MEIVVAEWGMNLRRFDGRWCSNRVEQVCVEDCALIEILRVIRQTRDGRLAQPLQFVWFPQRSSSIFYLLTDAGTLRLGNILGHFHITDTNGCVSMNLYGGAVGKNKVVEGHVRGSRGGEIPTQNLSCTSGRTGNRGHKSFDRRALGNRRCRSGINRFNQPSSHRLTRLSDAQTLLEPAPKIITCSDHDRILWRLSILCSRK